jgi:uncharacterized phage protein (TIGR02220 family)
MPTNTKTAALTQSQKDTGNKMTEDFIAANLTAIREQFNTISQKRVLTIQVGRKTLVSEYKDGKRYINGKTAAEFAKSLTAEERSELRKFDAVQVELDTEMFKLLYDTLHKGYKWGIFHTVMEPYKLGLKSIKRPKVTYSHEKYGTLVKDVVEYLNMKAGTSFRYTSTETIGLIIGRATEGYTINDFRMVVDRQVLCWLNDPVMVQYLRPSTLFNASKFNEYVNGTVITSQDTQPNIEGGIGEGKAQGAGYSNGKPAGTPSNGKVGKGRREFKSVENLQNLKRK